LDTKAVCLAVLSMGDASGYEIKKRVEEVFSRFLDVAPSGIYASLKSLDQEGLVSAQIVPQEGRPNKTIYTLLDAGRQALVAALSRSDGRHRIRSDLVALLMFADLLPPAKLREVLTNRMEELERTKAELECADNNRPGPRFLVRMGLAIVTSELSFLRENIPAFLEELGRCDVEPTENTSRRVSP